MDDVRESRCNAGKSTKSKHWNGHELKHVEPVPVGGIVLSRLSLEKAYFGRDTLNVVCLVDVGIYLKCRVMLKACHLHFTVFPLCAPGSPKLAHDGAHTLRLWHRCFIDCMADPLVRVQHTQQPCFYTGLLGTPMSDEVLPWTAKSFRKSATAWKLDVRSSVSLDW